MAKKLVFGIFSFKTASIVLLSVPVICFIQSFLLRYIEAENFFAEYELNDFDLTMFIIVCACISALIGIELKKCCLIVPVLLAIWISISAYLTTCIVNIVFYFDFNKGRFSSRSVRIQFKECLILGSDLITTMITMKTMSSLLKPVLWAILILIVSELFLVVRLIVKEFDFKNSQFSSHDVSVEFQEAVISELAVLYVRHIISTYYWDRIGEYELPQLTQTSKSNPSSKALLINV